MRLLVGCFCSAILGSFLTIWIAGPPGKSSVVAQERGGPAEGVSPVERVSPVTSRIFSPEGHTPDEAVTVAVYEAVNRSVVNITAKALRNDRSFFAGQSEGSGSGAVFVREVSVSPTFTSLLVFMLAMT